jgi:hypothetical protein
LTVNLYHEGVTMRVVPAGDVLTNFCDSFFQARQFFIEMTNLGAQSKLSFNMLRAEPGQAGNLRINARLFNHHRIAGSNGFDLGIGQCRAINILDASQISFAGHHLGDKPRLGFERLPHIRVE